MIGLASLLVLAVGLASGQLNFEGNPLTEYTDYTAEESNLSERTSREKDLFVGLPLSHSAMPSRPQKLYPIFEAEGPPQPARTIEDLISFKSHSQRSLSGQGPRSQSASSRQLQISGDPNSQIDPAEVALNTFLNSKTPEESRASLDYFLRSQQPPEAQPRSSDGVMLDQDKKLERMDVQPIVHQVEHQRQPLFSQVEQRQPMFSQADQTIQVHLTPQVDQGQLIPQLVPQQIDHHHHQQQQQVSAGQNYAYAAQPIAQTITQPVIKTSAGILGPATMLQPVPVVAGIRNDAMMPAMWRQRMKRIRAKPLPGALAQARIAPTMYKGPVGVPFKVQGPVEVIYTKPPGFHRGPPVPVEDGGWYSDSDYPSPSKDVYYSQLYAQSYDPHYYNYIGATGKIRPHLYGKLGKRNEEQDNGIWSELYRGFTKHGLKNIMTPTFLLGMTLPVVTLMLSALVQKRSIARSDARDLGQEDALQEYLERLQRAMICYGSNRDGSTKREGC